MGDTDALRDKIAQAAMPALHDVRVQIKNLYRDCACGVVAQVVADAVLPVVTQEVEALREQADRQAQATINANITLSLLRSRVEALADEIEARANAGCETGARREDCAICQSRWLNLLTVAHDLRSLSDNKEQQQ